jgi:FkbM family methyltransferase
MIQTINRLLPRKLKESFYWRVSRYFNKYYINQYDNIKLSKNLTIKGVSTDTISQQLFFQGYYDLNLSDLILSIAKNGGVFIDVGANIGYCSLLFANQNPKCQVLSFEPSLKNLTLLKFNIIHNKLNENITVYPYAVGDEEGEMYFDNGPADQTGWGHLSTKKTGQKVKVITLDSFIDSSIYQIDLLKIDVEGFDLQVILGSKKLLEKRIIKKIVFEYHQNLMNYEATDDPILLNFHKIIKQFNYKLEKFGAHDYLLSLKTL